MTMLSCRDVSEKASDYLDRNLPWWARAQVRMHLLLCEYCRRHVAQLKLVVESLRLSGKRDERARESADRILRRLRARH